jgi:oligoendopeptidase F
MSQNFQAGDFLIFQIESAYGLLRILAIDEAAGDKVYHLAAYNEMFLDIDTADAAVGDYSTLTVNRPHLALTSRAFASTQVARMGNAPLGFDDLKALEDWRQSENHKISDLSVRLLLGLR